ncbi:pectate lyase [Uliginosibacterium sp. 31-16]|uniref:pectate lyase n=1 Tax=Uliginosibacterium sp. 31-16 TaxID=3068315 RepID=UPI00273E71B9|nr:pectate lyase [Uliginosibacterium sp. 31-16]MDP5238412.1 pectate lyase [Uliginosibacterium sp. 31-16]
MSSLSGQRGSAIQPLLLIQQNPLNKHKVIAPSQQKKMSLFDSDVDPIHYSGKTDREQNGRAFIKTPILFETTIIYKFEAGVDKMNGFSKAALLCAMLLGTGMAQAANSRCVAGATFTNETVDCGGQYISGGWCNGDDDNQAPIIKLYNAKIINAKFAQGKAGKGIQCWSGTCSVENVTFDEVCEDAISTRADGVTLNIKGSTFKNTMSTDLAYGKKPDKFIQVNQKNVKVSISNSHFYIVPATSSTPKPLTGKAGKIVRTCGNCSGNIGPRTITMSNVYAHGPFSSIAGVNSKYRYNSTIDTVTISGLQVEGYKAPASGKVESTPPICEEFEGIDKAKDGSGVDSPKIGQAWKDKSKSCLVTPADVTALK